MPSHTIKEDTIRLLTRKRPMTYEGIVTEIHQLHPESKTSVATVQWYASRLRVAGVEVRVKRVGDRRDWRSRPTDPPKATCAPS